MSSKKTQSKDKDYCVYRRVTIWPDWLMAIFGFFASFLGRKGCDSIFYKLKGRLAAIEEVEVQEAESASFQHQKRATELLTGVLRLKADDKSHLTSRRFHSYVNSLAAAKADLDHIDEELEQQIMKTRDMAEAKLSAYLAGIHRGFFLRSYQYPEPLFIPGECKALEQYYESGRELKDRMIRYLEQGGSQYEE